jgi:glucan 1,3-beta-glucosidase
VWTDETHFEHWKNQKSNWLGEWDSKHNKYVDIDWEKLNDTVDKIDVILEHFTPYEAFYAFEPVNEPSFGTGYSALEDFYRQTRFLLQVHKPDAKFVFHDSFHTTGLFWNRLFDDDDMENVIMDFHPYMAFSAGFQSDVTKHCDHYRLQLAATKGVKYPLWAGEWSLATDTCAHWLNGFNDHRQAYTYTCGLVDCPTPYLPADLVPDFDRTAIVLGPTGSDTDLGEIHQGKCYTDSPYYSDQ